MANQVDPTIHERRLAASAFLMATFDASRDIIENYVPLVLSACAAIGRDEFTNDEANSACQGEYGLTLPSGMTAFILGRAVKRGQLTRIGGVYRRERGWDEYLSLRAERDGALDAHREMARGLQEFLARVGVDVALDEASHELAAFLDQYQVSLIEDGGAWRAAVAGWNSASKRMQKAIAAFLAERLQGDPQCQERVSTMLNGCVVRNAILLPDAASPRATLKGLRVYLDTQVVIRRLGYYGLPEERAAAEGLQALERCGAQLRVLATTEREIRRVFMVYAEHLRTIEGTSALYDTPLTRYVLNNRISASKMLLAAGSIEAELRKRGIRIDDQPKRVAATTWDEAKLAKMLADRESGGDPLDDPRVAHDVDAIAAVLSVRAGKTSHQLEGAVAVFASYGFLTIQNCTRWYHECGGTGMPPIAAFETLTSAAWLKAPSVAPQMKLHELIASCATIARPSEEVWAKFRAFLKELKDRGSLSEGEYAVALVSRMTDQLLSRAEVAVGGVDSKSIGDVIDTVLKENRAEVQGAQAARAEAEERERKTREHVDSVADRVAGGIAISGACVLVIVLAAATVWQAASGAAPIWYAVPISVALGLGGLAVGVLGSDARGWYRTAKARIAARIRVMLRGR